MAGVFWCEALAFEYMAQMPVAVGAKDFRAPFVRVDLAFHRAFDFRVKTRPTTARIEFVGGAIKWRIATLAQVHAMTVELAILATERRLGALV